MNHPALLALPLVLLSLVGCSAPQPPVGEKATGAEDPSFSTATPAQLAEFQKVFKSSLSAGLLYQHAYSSESRVGQVWITGAFDRLPYDMKEIAIRSAAESMTEGHSRGVVILLTDYRSNRIVARWKSGRGIMEGAGAFGALNP